MNIDKRALREVAERATQGPWEMEQENIWFTDEDGYTKHLAYVEQGDDVDDKQDHYNTAYIAAANPATMLALLDELDIAQHTAAVDHEAACALVEENEELKRKLEAENQRNTVLTAKIEPMDRRIAELSKAASVNSQWKPDVCPVTGRQFFMWIEHETLGYVPTYGGPFDSYTIPTRDSSGEFSCERYDHDLGGWVGGEFIGLYLIDDDEQCRVIELEERIAKLEARTVNLSKRSVGEVMHMSGFSRDYAEGWCAGNDNAIHEIRTVGIKVKEL
ncbi:ead/Ea22-like family protein [Salmonella enterica]|nr:ead/Ea22-like family protein [Salmonella enterica]